jgi:hypothetical protein
VATVTGVAIRAAGGIGADASTDLDLLAPDRSARAADAAPVVLKALAKQLDAPVPRLVSRFTELATLGARAVLARHGGLPPETPLLLATGLGDVARTDGLYYQVMPPTREMASPAQFATSGNNIPAFFVAQQAGLASRNFTISMEALSFERAVVVASAELRSGMATHAFVGGVDETTVPRDFLVRRFPPAGDGHLGEGSAWFVLGGTAGPPVGELIDAWIAGPREAGDARALARRVAGSVDAGEPVRILRGLRCDDALIGACIDALPRAASSIYLDRTGMFPTAVALAMAASFVRRDGASLWLHLARDRLGRVGVIVWRTFA